MKLRKNIDPDFKNFYGVKTTAALKKTKKVEDAGVAEQGEAFVDENGDVVGLTGQAEAEQK